MKYFIPCFLILLIVNTAIGQNHPPVAVNDTVWGVRGYPVFLNPLKNDYDPDGDSIFMKNYPGMTKVNDTTWKIDIWQIDENYDTILRRLVYTISDEHGDITGARIIIRNSIPVRHIQLDINNISALISPFGNHFWDTDSSRFEVPKGTGKTAMFSHNLWVGGLNDTGQLCLAGEFYRQQGTDFFMGPVSDSYDSTYMLRWNRLWKLDKKQIQYHINNWSKWGYIPNEAIANWPAHGDVTLGQSADIAPFSDRNANGTYEPMEGDYPLIRGDQAVFFVLNDTKDPHTESNGRQLGIELHGMAYAYDRPKDSTLNNTIFMHYDILNRSTETYQNTLVGWFNDFDLGYANDDYLGCDVTNGMIYACNGDSVDGFGEPNAYGAHPPAIGMKVIGGPYLEPDGIDNPPGNCDEGINGLNFGDGIQDNERLGVSYFIMGWSSGGFSSAIAPEYYNIMQGIRRDGTPFMYGDKLMLVPGYGGGEYICYGGAGPACHYLFTGDSDTLCNWGTRGEIPEEGFNQNGYYWTEKSVEDEPGDRRGVGSVGPFTFSAGQSIPIDYCYTWARDYQGDNNSSVELLRERIAGMKPYWNSLIQLPVTYYSVPEQIPQTSFSFYPNPVFENARITLDGNEILSYYLYAINGKLVSFGILKPGINNLDFSILKPGVYLFKCAGSYIKVIKM